MANMSSITLHVALNNVGKKITTTKTATVNQVVQQALAKFGLDYSRYPHAVLLHNNKKLDVSLPIRLTNLINNAKLKLEPGAEGPHAGPSTSGGKPVNVKLVITALDNTSHTSIVKVMNNTRVVEILNSANAALLDYDQSQFDLVVHVLDNKLSHGAGQLNALLVSLIGDTSSLVVRCAFSRKDTQHRQHEQQRIVELQLAQQKDRQLKQELEQRQKQEQRHELEQRQQQEAESQKHQVHNPEQSEAQSQQQEHNQEQSESQSQQQEHNPEQSESQSQQSGSHIQSPQDQPAPATDKIDHREQTPPTTEPAAPTGPQLYKPSSTSSNHSVYENPDEDYEMSISQAQKYHQLVANGSRVKKKSASPSSALPSNYTIRIKFPNQSILQFQYDNGSTVKLGQIFKQIDSLLLPQFIDRYNLKLGFPPFSKIGNSFSENGTKLHDLPAFQTSGKITLIWECVDYVDHTNNDAGFVKEDAVVGGVLSSSQLPEVVLESNRGQLADDEEIVTTGGSGRQTTTTTSGGVKRDGKGNKVPKWFKLK